MVIIDDSEEVILRCSYQLRGHIKVIQPVMSQLRFLSDQNKVLYIQRGQIKIIESVRRPVVFQSPAGAEMSWILLCDRIEQVPEV